MKLLSIDAHWSKGFAFAMFNGSVKPCYFDKVDTLKQLEEYIYTKRWDMVITEDPYLGMNVKTLKQLCFSVGAIMYMCQMYNVIFIKVRPKDWKNYFGLTQKTPKAIEKIIRKEMAGIEGDVDKIGKASCKEKM